MQFDKGMKRCLAVMMILGLLLMGGSAAYSAIVYKLWLADGLTGGTATSLDGIHSGTSGVPNGAFALVVDNGTSRFYVFRFDSGVTGAQNTATHPFVVVPVNDPATGVWMEVSGVTSFM